MFTSQGSAGAPVSNGGHISAENPAETTGCAGANEPGARSSAEERPVHIREVAGSIPAAPTIKCNANIVEYRGKPAAYINFNGKRRRGSMGNAKPEHYLRLKRELIAASRDWTMSPKITDNARDILHSGLRGAKHRCRGTIYSVTIDLMDLVEMYNAQKGCCAISGIPFDVGPSRESARRRNPFRPSIDRIDSMRGYELANVRLVCAAVNYAMGPWGEGVFRFIAGLLSSTL